MQVTEEGAKRKISENREIKKRKREGKKTAVHKKKEEMREREGWSLKEAVRNS